MIVINQLRKEYNSEKVVDISFLEIKKGELIGLVGNNGAGKTTLLRLILDIVQADCGIIVSMGKTVAKTEGWKKYTSAYLDEGFLIDYLTPYEYFYFCGKLQNISKADVDIFLKSIDSFLGNDILESGKYIRELSKGNQQKVGIAASLLQQPKFLILDEPFANLDPTSQIKLKKILTDIYVEKEITIIVSSHDINQITDSCTRILLMEKGKIIKDLKREDNTFKELETYFKG